MRISVKAKPAASRDEVKKIADDEFVVSTIQPPIQGRANRAILKLLADFLGKPVASLRIVSGYTARSKIVEIL